MPSPSSLLHSICQYTSKSSVLLQRMPVSGEYSMRPVLCFRESVLTCGLCSMLPFSLGGAAFSVISGQLTSRTGRWRPIVWFSWAIMTLGWGLMTMLDDKSNE